MKLRIKTDNIPTWMKDSRLTNNDLKLVSTLVFSTLVTFIHHNSFQICFTMNELIEDVRNTVNCHNQSIKDGLKILIDDDVVSKVK